MGKMTVTVLKPFGEHMPGKATVDSLQVPFLIKKGLIKNGAAEDLSPEKEALSEQDRLIDAVDRLCKGLGFSPAEDEHPVRIIEILADMVSSRPPLPKTPEEENTAAPVARTVEPNSRTFEDALSESLPPSIIKNLFDAGFTTPESVVEGLREEIEAVEGYGKGRTDKVIQIAQEMLGA